MGNKILFSGYYGFDNSGDDAILQVIISGLRERDPSLDMAVLSYSPLRTQRAYDVEGIQRFRLPDVVRAMEDTDLLISGGGSLLQDITSSRSLYYYLFIIWLALRKKKKVYIYANGVGPIDRPLNQKLTRKILNQVDLITLRDQGSYETLKKIGVRRPPMEVTADPVYGLGPSDRAQAERIFRREGLDPDKPYIGVAVREWGPAPALATRLAHVLDQVYEALGVPILFVPLHFPKDLHFSEEVIDHMVHKEGALAIKGTYSSEEIKGLLGQTQVVLAMRLHALIYAATEAVPLVGLVYDPKVSSHLEDLGIQEAVRVEDFDERVLANMINRVYRDREAKSQALKDSRIRLARLSEKNLDYVFDLLEKDNGQG